jgi:hypothetical protein
MVGTCTRASPFDPRAGTTSVLEGDGWFRCTAFAWVRQSSREETEESPMSTVEGQYAPGGSPSREPADLELEEVVIPVAEADRSKAFDTGLGLRLDADWDAEYMVREQSDQEVPV